MPRSCRNSARSSRPRSAAGLRAHCDRGSECAPLLCVGTWRSFALLSRASRSRAELFSAIEGTENHVLVSAGVYKYVRHPITQRSGFMGVAQALLWLAGSRLPLSGVNSTRLAQIGMEPAVGRPDSVWTSVWRAHCRAIP